MRFKTFLGLTFFVFLFCVLLRFYYPLILNAYPQYFYNGVALLNTHDGYFYAQGAKNLLSLYQELKQNLIWDFWQTPQDFFEILNSPHLLQDSAKSTYEILSIFTAFLALCLPFNLEQILFFMPGIFGSLVVFPIMTLTRNLGVIPCIFSGILAGISVSYYNRTIFGYYDTDMLVIVLGLSVGVMILRTWKTQHALDCAILLGLCALSVGYYSNLRYILFGYILILLLFLFQYLYEKSQKESLLQWIILGLLFLLTLEILFPKLTFIWIFFGLVLGFILDLLRKYFGANFKGFFLFLILCNLGFLLWRILPSMLHSDYLGVFLKDFFEISSNEGAKFHYLNVLDSIAEVSNVNLGEFAYRVSGGIAWLILSALGYVWLILKDKKFLIFLPFLVLGCFALVQGLRFSFYAVPISALGLSFLLFKIQEVLEHFKYRIPKHFVVFSFVFLAILPHLWHIKNYIVAPILEASEAEILHSINAKNGDFALAWWDYGYWINYFGDLQTFIDGGKHSGMQNFPISLAFSTQDEMISYNIAKMLINAESLEAYLQENGIEAGLENLKTKRNVTKTQKELYIILPHRMLEIFPSIMRFSQIDLRNGKTAKLDFFALSISENKNIVNFKEEIILDKNTGEVFAKNLHTTIKKSIDLRSNEEQVFDEESALVAIFLTNNKTLLCAESYLESFYFKGLFFEQLNENLFQKVLKNDKITIYKLL